MLGFQPDKPTSINLATTIGQSAVPHPACPRGGGLYKPRFSNMKTPNIGQPIALAAGHIGGKRSLPSRLVAMIERVDHDGCADPPAGMGGIFLRRRSRPKVEAINGGHLLPRAAAPLSLHDRHAALPGRQPGRVRTAEGHAAREAHRPRAGGTVSVPPTPGIWGKVEGRNFGVDKTQGARFHVATAETTYTVGAGAARRAGELCLELPDCLIPAVRRRHQAVAGRFGWRRAHCHIRRGEGVSGHFASCRRKEMTCCLIGVDPWTNPRVRWMSAIIPSFTSQRASCYRVDCADELLCEECVQWFEIR